MMLFRVSKHRYINSDTIEEIGVSELDTVDVIYKDGRTCTLWRFKTVLEAEEYLADVVRQLNHGSES